MAVGYTTGNTDGDHALADNFDGRRWRSEPISHEPMQRIDELQGVSCTSEHFCAAVGVTQTTSDDTLAIVSMWNGHAWATRALPDPTAEGEDLEAVSCTSRTSCLAVGQYFDSDTPLAEHWDGDSWATTSNPPSNNPDGFDELTSVTCQAPDECLAVGNSDGDDPPLVDDWDGSAWTIDAGVPDVNVALDSVSCPAPGSCLAVGYDDLARGVGFRLRGSTWTETKPKRGAPRASTYFDGVACATAKHCTAVGAYGLPGQLITRHPLIAKLTASKWSTQTSPMFRGSIETALDAVSCSSATSCMAVGNGDYIGDLYPPVAEQWKGHHWRMRDPIRPSDAVRNQPVELSGVSCTRPSACTAVGSYFFAVDDVRPLIERWNGNHWKIENGVPRAAGSLEAVSCPTHNRCMAVGGYGDDPLAERWNGKHWSLVTTLVPAGDNVGATFGSVSCPSARNCTAVGAVLEDSDVGASETLIENWTGGQTWHLPRQPEGPADSASAALASVDCPTTHACTAVGGYEVFPEPSQTLAYHWNGTRWTIEKTPNPHRTLATVLNGVACRSAWSCKAVGTDLKTNSTSVPFATGRHRSGWKAMSIKIPRHNLVSGLLGISCPKACTAAGSVRTDLANQRTLIESTR